MALTKVSTDGVKSNAINTAKIVNGSIQSEDIADNQIITDKILNGAVSLAKLPHGDTNNDGKFLRANNGADPSFESIPAGTTINNNAADRIITGEGGTTLNGESNLTFNGNQLAVTGTSTVVGQFNGASIPTVQVSQTTDSTDLQLRANSTGGLVRTASNTPLVFGTNQTERMRIDSSGTVLINTTTTFDSNKVNIHGTKAYSANISQQQLNVSDAQAYNVTDNGGAISFSAKYNNGGSYTTMSQIEGVKANNTDGNYEGAIKFSTRHHNGNMVEKVRIGQEGLSFEGSSGSANCLDDYEEGTYTPVVGAAGWNAVATTAQGSYVKVGTIMTVHINYASTSFSAVGMNDYLYVTLPVNSKSAGATSGTMMTSYWAVGTQDIGWLAGEVDNNTDKCMLWYHNNNNNNTNNTTKSIFQNALYFRGTIVYQTD